MQKEIYKLSFFPFQRILFIRNWKSIEARRRTDGLFHFHRKIYDTMIWWPWIWFLWIRSVREAEKKRRRRTNWGGGGIRPWGALGFTANWQLAAQIAMSCKCTQWESWKGRWLWRRWTGEELWRSGGKWGGSSVAVLTHRWRMKGGRSLKPVGHAPTARCNQLWAPYSLGGHWHWV